MSVDARISLSLYAYHVEDFNEEISDWFNCFVQHPNCRQMVYGDDMNWTYIKEIEALVQSLAAFDSSNLYELFCRECGIKLEEYHKEEPNGHCPICNDPMIAIELHKKRYDSKLKVTFGSGTYNKKSIGGTFKIEKEVIEPLTTIEQLCHELGVQIYYE